MGLPFAPTVPRAPFRLIWHLQLANCAPVEKQLSREHRTVLSVPLKHFPLLVLRFARFVLLAVTALKAAVCANAKQVYSGSTVCAHLAAVWQAHLPLGF